MLQYYQCRIGTLGKEIPSSPKRDLNQVNSVEELAKALYSDSVLDLETVGCFLELRDSRLLPRKVLQLDVEWRSSGLPTQSESENATS